MTQHHTTMRRIAPGVTEVARPLRGTGWTQWRTERSCRKTTGHCWHPEGMIDWWCCMCSANTDGMPPQRCVFCTAEPIGPAPECQGADFTRLLNMVGENLREHAKRDGLSEIRTALFLSRGGHAPGDVCPSAQPGDVAHASWCSALLDDECDCGAEQPEGSDRA